MTAFLLFMFGITAIASAIMFYSWTRLMTERLQEPVRPKIWSDRILIIPSNLAVGAFAVTLLCGRRVVDILSPFPDTWLSLALLDVALVLLAGSKVGLIYAATLDRRSLSLQLLAGLAVVWGGYVFWWAASTG